MAIPPNPQPRLPPREIEARSPAWRGLALRLGLPIIVAIGLVLAVNHRSSGVIGALLALLVLAAIIAIEVPLILRSQRRRQQHLLDRLPNGAFYACRGSTMVPGRRTVVTGNIVLDREGVTFLPSKGDLLITHWSDVSYIGLSRSRSAPLAGSLVLTKVDGGRQTFTVRQWGGLAEALSAAP